VESSAATGGTAKTVAINDKMIRARHRMLLLRLNATDRIKPLDYMPDSGR